MLDMFYLIGTCSNEKSDILALRCRAGFVTFHREDFCSISSLKVRWLKTSDDYLAGTIANFVLDRRAGPRKMMVTGVFT